MYCNLDPHTMKMVMSARFHGILTLTLMIGIASSARFDHKSINELQADDYIYAHCEMVPDAADITGTVDFRQPLAGGNIEIHVNVGTFDTTDSIVLHGFHVHEFGDLSDGCTSAGDHFNPLDSPHGAPENDPQHRHVGDFGNIMEDENGNIDTTFEDYLASLMGDFSIIGRAAVVHEMRDDLGEGGNYESTVNGNAGTRYACCVIGLSDSSHWTSR